jgi:NTE family protein
MLLELATSPRRGRTKLGLALAGGGFRASLFHVGVLRELARRGLLGKVEVLSTVSGGSIVGALYYLGACSSGRR